MANDPSKRDTDRAAARTQRDTQKAAFRTGRRNTATQRDTQRAAARTGGVDLADPFYQIGRSAPSEPSQQAVKVYRDDDSGGGGSSSPAPTFAGIVVKDGVLYAATINGKIGAEIT